MFDLSMLREGDKVRIVPEWLPYGECSENPEGNMDKWLGTIMTVRKIYRNNCRMYEDIKEHGGGGWSWNEHCIAGVIYNTSDGFNPGDRVRYISPETMSGNDELTIGCEGVVVCNREDKAMVGVEWDHKMSVGHDLLGRCQGKHGFWVYPYYICHTEFAEDDDTQDIDETEFTKVLAGI